MHISEQIWNDKYRFKTAEGEPIDVSKSDTLKRVATALAKAEITDRTDYVKDFYAAIEDDKFLPAGRIIAGAGTKRNVTLFNCFVMGTIPDSMGGIFEMLREAALTMQQGGGIGYDFSTLRPKGDLVEGVGSDASGPLSFMDVWDSMCQTIMSAGSRRGAMMATMRCDHPDIFDFVHAKKDPNRLRKFNLSVLVTDDFMNAVKHDLHWELKFTGKNNSKKTYKTVKARDLWDAIITSTYNQAEPGVIFIDRINEMNNLRYCEQISATNPCGEQPLPPYGACLLGSINLAKFVKDPFTRSPLIDFELLDRTITSAVRMMDNVVDVSNYPLNQQKKEAENKRRIGLGVTGLADMLAMMGMKYGSDEAVLLTENVMKVIACQAYLTSSDLASSKGSFPLFNCDYFLAEGTFASNMPDYVKEKIREKGIRNALLTSIAPTGTISLYAGNVSSGIEPIFAYEYTRKVLEKDGSHRLEKVEDYAVRKYREMYEKGEFNGGNPPAAAFDVSMLPEYFTSAQELEPEAHVRMQAAAQKWVDSSISKTINVPEDILFDDFKNVYQMAWDQGCKGCTTYRPNDITGSVLSVTEDEKPESVKIENKLQERPESLEGETYKIKFADDEHALYVTITDAKIDGKIRPFEIFLNTKNPNHHVWTVALTRMISAVFRMSETSQFVVQELQAVFDPKGGAWHQGRYMPSVIAAIGDVIEKHMQKIGFMEPETPTLNTLSRLSVCDKCGALAVSYQNGCGVCGACGHSTCG